MQIPTTAIAALQLWLATLIRDPIGTLLGLPRDLSMAVCGFDVSEKMDATAEVITKISRSLMLPTACRMERIFWKIFSKINRGRDTDFDAQECEESQGLRVSLLLLKTPVIIFCLHTMYRVYRDSEKKREVIGPAVLHAVLFLYTIIFLM